MQNETPSNPAPNSSNPGSSGPPSDNIVSLPNGNTAETGSQSSRLVLTDAHGRVVSDPETAKYILTPFPDGTVFRYGKNPKGNGFVIVDHTNAIVAASGNEGVAQIICEGAFHWLRAKMVEALTQAKLDKQKAGDTLATDEKSKDNSPTQQ